MDSQLKTYLLGIFWGLQISLYIGILVDSWVPNKTIPNQSKVQQGYIAPSKLEIECKDLDGNGELETIIRISDKPYLLRTVNGKPVISRYEIKPAQSIPTE